MNQSNTMRLLSTIILLLLFIVLSAFVLKAPELLSDKGHNKLPAGKEEILNELPFGFNDLFAGSAECALCHSSMVDNQGESISIVNDWRSSMKANSARDPFWRAKVSHETLVNPDHAEVLEDVCTRCHAPMGHFNAHFNGQELYSIEDMESDPLAMDGVSCTVCHQITEASLGNFSGELIIGENKKIWGPYEDPFPNPMVMHTGYTPEYSPHIKDSRLCGSCHTLITNTVDLNGEPTGTQFVEQAIYHEWLNSSFSTTGIQCQNCHVPEIQDDVTISTMPPWLGTRTPFGLHHLTGANVFMLKMLRDNIDDLGLTATAAQFDTTISRAMEKLQMQSVMLDLQEVSRSEDTLYVNVSLLNIAGHKLPGGYPSRRVFVSLEVINESDDIIFHSGSMDENYNLVQEDTDYEGHHAIISDPDQVQIYELVMGNVDLEVTTILEQAYVPLKDNRIPPAGFVSSHPSYDTVLVAGNALLDTDFNQNQGIEGTGMDLIHFHIPTAGNGGQLQVRVKVYYQTVNDKWLEEMFEYSSDEIDLFKGMYDEADKEPVLMAEESFISASLGIEDIHNNIIFSPNPVDDYVHVRGLKGLTDARWYTLNGELLELSRINSCEDGCFRIKSPGEKGFVILVFNDLEGQEYSKKLIVR